MSLLFRMMLTALGTALLFALPMPVARWIENRHTFRWHQIAVPSDTIAQISDVETVRVEDGYSFRVKLQTNSGREFLVQPEAGEFWFVDSYGLHSSRWLIRDLACDSIARQDPPTKTAGRCFMGNIGGMENSLNVWAYVDGGNAVWIKSHYSTNGIVGPALWLTMLSPVIGCALIAVLLWRRTRVA
jgi:hypothetical protein